MKKYEYYIASQNTNQINKQVQKAQEQGFEVAGNMTIYDPKCSSGRMYAKIPMRREIFKLNLHRKWWQFSK